MRDARFGAIIAALVVCAIVVAVVGSGCISGRTWQWQPFASVQARSDTPEDVSAVEFGVMGVPTKDVQEVRLVGTPVGEVDDWDPLGQAYRASEAQADEEPVEPHACPDPCPEPLAHEHECVPPCDQEHAEAGSWTDSPEARELLLALIMLMVTGGYAGKRVRDYRRSRGGSEAEDE